MKCKVCKHGFANKSDVVPVNLGRLSFVVHEGCRGAVTEGAQAVGAVLRTVVNLRTPGFFDRPMVRAAGAALRELGTRKSQ